MLYNLMKEGISQKVVSKLPISLPQEVYIHVHRSVN